MTVPPPIFSNALVELFLKGGPIMWPIGVLTLFSVAVIVERLWWWFLLSRNRNADMLDRVLTALEAGNAGDALKLCEGSQDPVLRVISAGITHRHASLQGALQAAAGVEIKRADAPRLSSSMRQALADLELDRLLVITPSERGYRLNDRTEVVPLGKAVGVFEGW